MKGEAASDFLQRNKEEHNMLSDGLKYQDSRMATCEEMKQDLAPFALHDAAAKSKDGRCCCATATRFIRIRVIRIR